MATFSEPTKEDAVALFEAIEQRFPHKAIGDDIWYMVVVSWQHLTHGSELTDICQLSALVGVEPEHAVHLYTYLINKPQFATSENRQTLVRRLREALVKNVSIQGVCKPLEALFSIAKVERPEDRDYTFSRLEEQPKCR